MQDSNHVKKGNKYKNTQIHYNNFNFKSKQELNCYKTFKEAGFELQYEKFPISLMSSFKPLVNVYLPSKSKDLVLTKKSFIGITYHVDFYLPLERNGRKIHVFIEVKGMPNDVYPLKKKMFIKALEEQFENPENIYFFEVHNIRQVHQAINIINSIV